MSLQRSHQGLNDTELPATGLPYCLADQSDIDQDQ
jgi:hypothetical protein